MCMTSGWHRQGAVPDYCNSKLRVDQPRVYRTSVLMLSFERYSLKSLDKIPYTRVNKRICLFPKLQGNMRLIPNMRLIMKGKKLTTPPKPRRLFGSTCTWQRTRQVKRTRKLSVLTWCSPWNLQRVWAVMPWQTLVLVLMRTADVDEESSRRDRRYCIVEIR